ncbi:hypothetical protein PDIDSM_5676 [Penicillium digitatum]|nr:hypothetical protein PDIDSM_5676 [Penicillium digitatum]
MSTGSLCRNHSNSEIHTSVAHINHVSLEPTVPHQQTGWFSWEIRASIRDRVGLPVFTRVTRYAEEHQNPKKDRCTPTPTSTDTVSFLKPGFRFISVRLRGGAFLAGAYLSQ